MHSRNPIFIEVAGLPGSGKTRLIRDFENSEGSGYSFFSFHYINSSSKVVRFFRKLQILLLSIILRPGRSRFIIRKCRECHESYSAAFKDIVNFLYLLYKYDQAKKEKKSDVQLFDQGFIQAIWSLSMFGSRKPDFELIRYVLKEIHYVIFVRTDPAIAAARLQSREDQGSRIQITKSMNESLEKGDALLEELIDFVKNELDPNSVYIVENNTDSKGATSIVHKCIESITKLGDVI